MTTCRRALPLFFIIPAIIALVFAATAVAQHQTAPPAHDSQQKSEAAGTPQQPAQHGGEASQGAFGKELAHTSREAAGEEHGEGHEEFKQSASVQLLARMTGLDVHKAYWVAVILNFVIIAGLVFMISKSKVPGLFRARTESIQKGIEEARKASEEANRRLTDIQARLSRLDSEIAEMRKAAEAEAVKEEQRLQASIEEEKRKLVLSAEQEIATAAKVARRDLKAYAAELAVSLAEKKIRVDAATDEALVSSFVDQLGKDGR